MSRRSALARSVFWLTFGAIFCIVFIPTTALASILTFGVFRERIGPWALRVWGRTLLRLAGVRLEVHGAEHLQGIAPRIVTFNHASELDVLIVGATIARRGVPVAKREVLYLPVLGLGAWAFGFVLVTRGDRENAVRSLARAAERVRAESLSVVVAPEGTRTRTGALQPFKLGPFHLSRQAEAPIVPIVIHDAGRLHPSGRWWTEPGRLRVVILPPQPPVAPGEERARADALHRLYEAALADPPP